MPRLFGGGKRSSSRAVYSANTTSGIARARSISIAGLSASNFSPDASITVGTSVTAVDISPDGKLIAMGFNTSPYIRVYPYTANASSIPQAAFGTVWANPATLPPSTVTSLKFSPGGGWLVATFAGSLGNIAYVYKITQATSTIAYSSSIAQGEGYPGSGTMFTGSSVEFAPDSSVVFVGASAVGSGVTTNQGQTLVAYAFSESVGLGSQFSFPNNALFGNRFVVTTITSPPPANGVLVNVGWTLGSPVFTIVITAYPAASSVVYNNIVTGQLITISGMTSTPGGLAAAYFNGQHKITNAGGIISITLPVNATTASSNVNVNVSTTITLGNPIGLVTSIACSPANNNNNPLWEGYVAVTTTTSPFLVCFPWFYATGAGTAFGIEGQHAYPIGPSRNVKFNPAGTALITTADTTSTTNATSRFEFDSGDGNWASWTSGSNVLTITLTLPGSYNLTNGVAVGDSITISGITTNFGGWTTAQLNGAKTVADVISDSTFTVTIAANATSTGTGGGKVGYIQFNVYRVIGWVWDNTASTGGFVNKMKNVTADALAYGLDVSPDGAFFATLSSAGAVGTYKLIPSATYPYLEITQVNSVAGGGTSAPANPRVLVLNNK